MAKLKQRSECVDVFLSPLALFHVRSALDEKSYLTRPRDGLLWHVLGTKLLSAKLDVAQNMPRHWPAIRAGKLTLCCARRLWTNTSIVLFGRHIGRSVSQHQFACWGYDTTASVATPSKHHNSHSNFLTLERFEWMTRYLVDLMRESSLVGSFTEKTI